MSSVLTESRISKDGKSYINSIKAVILTPIKYGTIETTQEVPMFLNFKTSTQIEIPEGGMDLGFTPDLKFVNESEYEKDNGTIGTGYWLDFAKAVAHYEASKK